MGENGFPTIWEMFLEDIRDGGEGQRLRDLLLIHRRNLDELQRQVALVGLPTPLVLVNSIRVEEEAIERVEGELLEWLTIQMREERERVIREGVPYEPEGGAPSGLTASGVLRCAP